MKWIPFLVILQSCTIYPVVKTKDETIWLGASVLSTKKDISITSRGSISYNVKEASENGTEVIATLTRLLWPF